MKNGNAWEKFPTLTHLAGQTRDQMERRRRHRQVRYLLFRLQTVSDLGRSLDTIRHELPPAFADFWMKEYPRYMVMPTGQKAPVPPARNVTVEKLGGYKEFAKKWDVDDDLMVYLRHASVWQEWNARLAAVVPILGE